MTRAPATPRLLVDWTRCDGHGLCRALLPARIGSDEWGFPVVHDPAVDPADRPAARRAITACPALALRLEPVPAP